MDQVKFPQFDTLRGQMWGHIQKRSSRIPAADCSCGVELEVVSLPPVLSAHCPELDMEGQTLTECYLEYTLCKSQKCYDHTTSTLIEEEMVHTNASEPMERHQVFNLHGIGPWSK